MLNSLTRKNKYQQLIMTKKHILKGILILFVCAITSVFCGCVENKLKAAVEEGNKSCPISLGLTGELTSISYQDDTVQMLYTMDEQFMDIDSYASNPEDMKTTFMSGMRDEESKKLLKLLTEADADFTVVYKGKVSGKEASFKISSNELKKELDKPLATNDEKLKLAINETNKQLPIDLGTGIVITELVDKGDVVVYMAKVADKEQFRLLSSNTENTKNSQKIMFKMMASAEKIFFKLIVDAGKDLGYLYYTDGTDETFEIVHTNSELREIFE